jgi:hypothetical protein
VPVKATCGKICGAVMAELPHPAEFASRRRITGRLTAVMRPGLNVIGQ